MCQSFLNTASISLLVIHLFMISASSFSFGRLCFLEICPFLPGFQISWHIVVHSNFLQSFVFLWYWLYLSLLFLALFIWVMSLYLLMSLDKGLSILFIFSKNQLLDSLILGILHLFSMSFNSALTLVISFLVLALGCHCCCSSSSCRFKVRLFI